MVNEEKIVNKIIPIDTILEVANYLEDQKEEYVRKFEMDKRKNQGVKFSEQVYEYREGTAKVEYEVKFKDGKSITKTDYNWFRGILSNLNIITGIKFFYNINYSSIDRHITSNLDFKRLHIFVSFSEENVLLRADGKNMEEETYKAHSYIKGVIENNENRYNRTVKNRKIRIQSLCFSIGFILSYILYFILIANKTKLSSNIANYLDNKMILIFGQWFISAIIGNVFGLPIMLALYKNILPKAKYSHYSRNLGRGVFVDDIEQYISNNEVQIGQFANNANNRMIIEKIYKVTSKIVLVQVVISVILFLVMK